MPYFDCKIVVIQGKIDFIKVILIEKIDDFSSPQARNFEKTKVIKGILLLKIAYFSPPQAEKNEKTKVIKGILLLKITYFSPPQAENFTTSVCKKSEKFCKK